MYKNLLTGFINLLYLRGVRILVSASDPLFRRYLCRALGALGHDARAVSDGAELFASASADAPDAVVCDVDPPDGGILGVYAELRRARPGVRLVAVTGDCECATRARGFGLDGVLIKPFSLEQLRGALPPF